MAGGGCGTFIFPFRPELFSTPRSCVTVDNFSKPFPIANASFQHLLKPSKIAPFSRNSSRVIRGINSRTRRRIEKRKGVCISCSSFLSHLVMKKKSNSPTDSFIRFLMQPICEFLTLVILKKKESKRRPGTTGCNHVIRILSLCLSSA